MKKVILITGASSGMGKDYALDLLKKGHVVYGLARRVEKMDDIVKAGGKAIAMDITNEAQIESAVNQVLQEQGKVDVQPIENCPSVIVNSSSEIFLTSKINH